MSKVEKKLEGYWEKSERTTTWSKIPLQQVYGPNDVAGIDYGNDIANPGEYPYTRGIYSNMYRGRLWTTRQISGHSSPEASNKRLKFLFEAGQTGFNLIVDNGGGFVDSDHPLLKPHVGVHGVPFTSLRDMEIAMDGIQLHQVSAMFSAGLPVFVQYLVLAEQRGIPEEKLRATAANDPIGTSLSCNRERGETPWDMRMRMGLDIAEYAIRHLPSCYPFLPDEYDLREAGCSAIQGAAFSLSIAFQFIGELVKRGLYVDQIAPRISFSFATHLDIFEEVAKYRAIRRLWARTMKEKFGAKDSKSMRFKFHTNTCGSMQIRPQMMNNVIRSTCASLAAILAGCQSLNTTPYDEPLMIPTEESHRLAIRTQQILAYEAGASTVTDPLGGSYYVESLTNQMEEEISALIHQIEERGGALAAAKSGWMGQQIEEFALRYQKEVESGERIIVGRNAFLIPEEDEREPEAFEIDQAAVEKHLANLRELRRTRDEDALRRAIANLRLAAEDAGVNLVPAMKEATRAYATGGEITGTIREAYGHRYDPYDILQSPFN